MQAPSNDAIVLRDVVKRFRKRTIRGEYTTFKSELVRWLRGQRHKQDATVIEALRGINLTVPRGKTMGIIGRNGSGKSTLLKLITGIYTPTSGHIELNGRISALLDLGAGFHPDFSGRENILINGVILGMSRAEIRARMDEIIAFSELGDFIDEPVRTYSSGMYMRLAFAVATHVDPEILIIDEILAVGDEHFSRKSMQKMTEFRNAGKTIVIVTHDLGTLERWCDLAAWIDGGRIREVGTPAEVVRHYRQAVNLAEASGLPMLAPALSPDGGALPTLEAAAQRPGSPVSLELLRLTNPRGEDVKEIGTEEGLEVHIGYNATQPVEDLGFSLALMRSDGTMIYRITTFADDARMPGVVSGRGTARLSIERLGLLSGDYTFDVSARTASGSVYDERKGVCPFSVRVSGADEGLVRLVHRWRLDGVAEAAPVRQVVS
ncbi:MAG TPA: ABC transporter ATP-binding protein [Archangium sp.]|uniref:ABC transporter ATP-binding protein n=1 Tax=Archangium sp. TaxID=1872627 RepID=UPI002E3429FA|nr:ABC transporter ATP-binding protein [Archangium sp.]HEX5747919.1 ABC transporter ATP-binding protein [Archangium sp.]